MFRIIIEGDVVDVRGSNTSAYLQFLEKLLGGGMKLHEVKVEGATTIDLQKYVGKMVQCEDVKVSGDAFNRFYKVDDITKVKEVKK